MANEELQALAALQIAQAKFKQGLRKPADGLASLDLEQATEICNALDAAFAQETTENIQVHYHHHPPPVTSAATQKEHFSHVSCCIDHVKHLEEQANLSHCCV
ncbi:hypothetical protein BU24DRAFT_20641 [Aaosphaeria arxii CBS 175.79]|uniref:Uncharacterized protein n=1 Tax=Aaosphaeria arxii CBS 175.79 TaxID=1450172 RepID=A0A6A5Y766_9PLEO|nr:uncharacterized protein BU24DRAFT_20641 [Aaosphaeria arxii CBS 175.79]KAF2021405.1 hypothetical protein BU24DRAFT_20641 [Aaosphaeria arxii CBS 175.79]